MPQRIMKRKTAELGALLRDGKALIERVPDDIYRAGAPPAVGGSVGMHARHVLDHYMSFFRGMENGRIDYDDRSRGSTVEQERGAACELIESICARLESLSEDTPCLTVEVRVSLAPGTGHAWVKSSVERELDFLLSHTIHHYAIIRMICTSAGLRVAPQFGMAPATLAYLASTTVPEAG